MTSRDNPTLREIVERCEDNMDPQWSCQDLAYAVLDEVLAPLREQHLRGRYHLAACAADPPGGALWSHPVESKCDCGKRDLEARCREILNLTQRAGNPSAGS